VPQDYLPPELAGRRFYEPTAHGDEARIAERLEQLRRWRDGE
jgi:putative ATPase